ncbi:MAG: TolC family protein [Betaproteobacteria bacterium]|nr:TolC family protein [Betaproteobacteria bacterium]
MNPQLNALFKITLLCGLLSAFGTSAMADTETLPAVVERVLLQQPSVRSAQALLNAADSQVSQVRSDYLPTASLGYRSGKSRDETQGIPFDRTVRRSDASLRWNLFNGGTDFYRLRSSQFARDAAETDLDDALERVAAEITENYADVVRLRQTISSLNETITRQERLEKQVTERVNAGRIPPAELDLMSVRLIQSRTLLGQLRTQLTTAEYRYRLLTGTPPEQLVLPAITAAAHESRPELLIENLRERNPRLRAALQRVSARQADIGAARGGLLPSIDLELSKRLNNNTDPVPVTDSDHGGLVRINLDIPLGGRTIARHNEAIERHEAAQADADQLSNDLAREIADLYGQLEELAKIDNSLEQRVLSAQRVAAAYELHFEAGRRSLNDVSIAHDDLFEAQRNLIEARARTTVLRARLLSMTGELRDALRTRYHPAPIAPELLGSKPAVPASAIAISDETAYAGADTASSVSDPITKLESRLGQWLEAWSQKNFEQYRAHYTPDFTAAGLGSTAAWENERRRRINQAVSPSIRIESLKSEVNGEDRATSQFTQHYTSGNFSDTVIKQIDWIRYNGQWLIAGETAHPLPSVKAASSH